MMGWLLNHEEEPSHYVTGGNAGGDNLGRGVLYDRISDCISFSQKLFVTPVMREIACLTQTRSDLP